MCIRDSLKNAWRGTIRFSGTISGVSCYGVELEKPMGDCDGTAPDEVQYFSCEKYYGTYVQPHQVSPFDGESHAANMIQRTWRMKDAQLDTDLAIAQDTFKALEEHGERTSTQEDYQVRRPLMNNFTGGNEEPLSPVSPKPSGDCSSPLKSLHPGANPSFPLGMSDVLDIIDNFKQKIPLHKSYVRRILKIATVELSQLPNVVRLSVPAENHITIVGDTHGQLQDVLTIFDINGMPSESNVYLFNGDFVDRGVFGCEIVILLLAIKLVMPQALHMNRGNHEDRAMNESERYGGDCTNFRTEVLDKYDNSMFHVFLRVFNALPLVHVINDKVMVVHGGLPREPEVLLEQVDTLIDRNRGIPTMGDGSLADVTFCDLMWCDPRDLWPEEPEENEPAPGPLEGCIVPNPYRGCGVLWGSDVTHRFLARNHLEMVIRSHEVEWEGYCYYHQNKVLSVFSASNYVSGGSNFGAFVKYRADTMDYDIQQYKSPPLDDYPEVSFKRTSALTELDNKNIKWVRELIAQHKLELYRYFSNRDSNIDGHIEQRVWASGLTQVLGLKLRWLSLRRLLYFTEHTDCEGLINYVKFLQGYKISSNEQLGSKVVQSTIEAVSAGLYEIAQTIEEAFEVIDVNRNGLIEYHEFVAALKQFGPKDLSEAQIYDVMRSLDMNNDNCIEMYEFVKRFEVAFHRVHWLSPEVEEAAREEWLNDAIRDLAKVMQGGDLSALREAFDQFDSNKDGKLSYEEFLQALCRVMPECYTLDQLRKLCSYADVNHDGSIEFDEFAARLTIRDNQVSDKNYMHSHNLTNFIWKNKAPLRTVYRLLDCGNGTISLDNLKTGLNQLNHLVADPLSSDELQTLLNSVDNSVQEVDYNAFLDGFGVDLNQD
eukprot:TRINITY_DN12908_c0_g1_i1.p1 TRINITY_DN12908_c0_g1~~TRINITY_DN12908_c0_g1_i1.p1  ORF type:complete len:880 (+),score=222.35 TRINITY_DN12908_c0_g1_i1:84-2723(+)